MLDAIENAETGLTLALPVLGLVTLLMSKLATGDSARRAERRFLATLVLVTVLAARTVIVSDDAWLLHMMTLALMIVGSLSIPGLSVGVIAGQEPVT